jgi:hypothetical protein
MSALQLHRASCGRLALLYLRRRRIRLDDMAASKNGLQVDLSTIEVCKWSQKYRAQAAQPAFERPAPCAPPQRVTLI